MTKEAVAAGLRRALGKYYYPCVVWDFSNQREIILPSMRKVEEVIRTQLTSRKPSLVKQGLANVVFWGHRSTGRWKPRLARFLDQVTVAQLEQAAQQLPGITGPGLGAIRELSLPEFSRISFLSKLRMFLDPVRHVVLDLRLARLKKATTATLFKGLSVQATCIPCTLSNERVYGCWCSVCDKWGRHLKWPAVDVERAVFVLAEEDVDAAADTVALMQADS